MTENRSFGLLFSAALLVLGALPWLTGGAPRPALLFAASVLAALALVWPRALGPLRRGWLALGAALSRVTRPLVLGVLYFVVLTPFTWLRRPRDTARRDSYWVPAEPPSPLDRPF